MSNLAYLLPGRAPRAVRSLLCAAGVLAVAACGGGGEGGGGTEPPPSATTARVDVAAQLAVAPATTGLTLRVTPAYELAAGGTAALTPVTATLTSAATQTVPVTIDVTACVNNPARAGADQGTGANAVCRVVAEYALLSGSRVIDAQSFGTYTVRRGTVTTQTVSFTEVASVRVTNAAGTVLADAAPVRAEVGRALTLTAAALRPDGAAASGRTVTWSSDNAAVAQVDAATGVITPVAAGQARLTAAVGDVRSAVVVTVVPAPAALAVTVAGGTGSGTVTASAGGVNCRVSAGAASGTCSAPVASDAAVTLTAAPDAGTAFAGWGGDCANAGTALQCTLAASGGAPRNVTVRFNAQRTLTVGLAGTGTGTVASQPAGISCSVTGAPGCTGTFLDGTSVTLTATPNAGFTFAGWTGACTGTGPCTVTLSQATSVTASFAGPPQPVRSVVTAVNGANDGGRYGIDLVFTRTLNGQTGSSAATIVLSTTPGENTFQLDADLGTPVLLTIRPTQSTQFVSTPGRIVSWGGLCAGTTVTTPNASCTFVQSANGSVTVNMGP